MTLKKAYKNRAFNQKVKATKLQTQTQVTKQEKNWELGPRDDIYLDLKFIIQKPETIEPWLNLLPSLKALGLHIRNEDWASNKTKDNTIQLHILNRGFNYTASIKKNQCTGFIFYLVKELLIQFIQNIIF